jgi:parallel beta-helix repeat protein
MKVRFIIFITAAFFILQACHKNSPLVQGETILTNRVIKKGTYYLKSDGLERPAMIISGNDIVIDFNGSTIIGDTNYLKPNEFTGLGIKVVNGNNITIKNVILRGFKTGLLADSIAGLKIEKCDFSYNYRPKLKSIREREDLSDWLSYHDNEKDQWNEYGAGIYLKNCKKVTIRDNHISQNQNALLLVGTDSSTITNNTFVYNSGLGLGLYRSTHNTIMHNCLDFNVRGYSHGFYRRGQDSAGALFYEQSSNNIFAYNSATHSGDGFFLYAGNETIESGVGGCNNNIIAYNDFSYAPTNGIEVTFSSNIIIGNKMVDCRYGIWGGYSYETIISDNYFERNSFGIAIEHGNTNTIINNEFNGDEVGIQLWERGSQPSDWGFATHRNISSRDYIIFNNYFSNVVKEYDIKNTVGIDSLGVQSNKNPLPKPLKGGINAEQFISSEGRDKILINEWGPYNFEYPLLWLIDISLDTFTFVVLGPNGLWKESNSSGYNAISSISGRMGDTIMIMRDLNEDLLEINLIYDGSDFIDQYGINQSGINHAFQFRKYEKVIEWDVKWYTYEDKNDPLIHYNAFIKLKNGIPGYSDKTLDLAYTWWRSPGGNIEPDHFGTFAKASANFTKGKYLIQITSDDGLRFYVDGVRKIDHWDIHVPATDSLEIDLSGQHIFELEHFEGEGFSTLDFRIELMNNFRDK